jgi:hypothetical protein
MFVTAIQTSDIKRTNSQNQLISSTPNNVAIFSDFFSLPDSNGKISKNHTNVEIFSSVRCIFVRD